MVLQNQISAFAEAFAKDLLHLLSQGTLSDLMGVTSSLDPASSRPSAPRNASSGLAPKGPLARRSVKKIEEVADAIADLLRHAPDGLQSEEIRKALGLDPKELPRPLALLRTASRIRSQGEKRATTYFLSGGGASKKGVTPAKKKAAAKKKASPKKAVAKKKVVAKKVVAKKAPAKKAVAKKAPAKKAVAKKAKRSNAPKPAKVGIEAVGRIEGTSDLAVQ